jgi:hypothetical protein
VKKKRMKRAVSGENARTGRWALTARAFSLLNDRWAALQTMQPGGNLCLISLHSLNEKTKDFERGNAEFAGSAVVLANLPNLNQTDLL